MSYSAQDFILDMEKTYGQGIFKAIVEGHDDRYLVDLESYREMKSQAKVTDFMYGNEAFTP